jgi:hypothetical protein
LSWSFCHRNFQRVSSSLFIQLVFGHNMMISLYFLCFDPFLRGKVKVGKQTIHYYKIVNNKQRKSIKENQTKNEVEKMEEKNKLEVIVNLSDGEKKTVDINNEEVCAGMTEEQKYVFGELRATYRKAIDTSFSFYLKDVNKWLYLSIGVGTMIYWIGNGVQTQLQHDTTPGYCDADSVKIEQIDLDHVRGPNGHRTDETLLIYKGNKFLLMEQEDGKPVVREYEITPEQNIPSSIKIDE